MTAGLVLVVAAVHSEGGRKCAEMKRHGVRACLVGPGIDARAVIDATRPAVVVIDMVSAGASASNLCRQLKRDVDTRLLPIVLICEPHDRGARLAGLQSGADTVLHMPVDFEELMARVRHTVHASQFIGDLESAASIIMTLTAMLEARTCSPGHCHRMANYAMALGRVSALSEPESQALYRGAFLHDIGMLALPDAVTHKSGPLESHEYELIKSHTVVGDALCANLRTLHAVRPIVRHHHERLDGTGYPDGLRGDEVPLLAQIVGIIDVFEAITAGRAYERPRTADEAIRVLHDEADRGWRRHDLVDGFESVVRAGALESARRPGPLLDPGSAATRPGSSVVSVSDRPADPGRATDR
ncbi:HD domain-containing phosphohydrolase [Luteitalea sp.]|uniref:HD-GYP domain-containing protein n=1 Tax=Luteitalea sp. TaxID=2004800 RepID=UPI0025C3DAE4|nr:HD domain-containing phosphohydrolase [Luteitalea sp.]